jgi:O-antigen biosynthesis protein
MDRSVRKPAQASERSPASFLDDVPPRDNSRIASAQADVDRLEAQVDRLVAALRLQKREISALHSKVKHLQATSAVTERRVTDLYDSRIWRTLVGLGQIAVDAQAGVRNGRVRINHFVNDIHGAWKRLMGADKDHVAVHIETPPADVVSTWYYKTEVRGWACAPTGIKDIEIFVGNTRIEPVETGIEREDVGAHLPHYPQSHRSGFKAEIWPDRLPSGENDVRVVVTSRSGVRSVTTCRVMIDHRSEYDIWLEKNDVENRRAEFVQQINAFYYSPLITIVTPVFRTPPEYLERCLESVRRQMYTNWEHILVDDGSGDDVVRQILDKWAAADDRIRVIYRESNGGIAAATNDGLQHAIGDFVGFLDHDDELAPHALYAVVSELNRDADVDIFYSDEDKIRPDGQRFDAFFKPGWSPDLLLAVNYMCHFLVCRRTLLAEVGGLRLGFDGSQDYDLLLRLTERTNRVCRIADILYHWRVSEQSTASDPSAKPDASAAGLRALNDHLSRTVPGAVAHELFPGRYRVRYRLASAPSVSVIIPTGGNPLLTQALTSLLTRTTWPAFEILVVDNSKDDSVLNMVQKFEGQGRPVRVVDCRRLPFNFSLLCNRAARTTDAPYLLFLNDDTSIITDDWIETMMEHAQRPEVGAVGSLLLFPDDRIQHAGVLMGVYGLAGHSFRLLDSRQSHYFHLPVMTRNCSAVTGACLLTRREVFWQVGGFDEANLPTAFQDVDLCLKMHEAGYRIVYTPHAQLYHYESASKKKVAFQTEVEYMQHRWLEYIDDDPYYNPNLTRAGESYSIRL